MSELIDEIAKAITDAEGKLFGFLAPDGKHSLVILVKRRFFSRLLQGFMSELRYSQTHNDLLECQFMGHEIWQCDDLDEDFTVALVPKQNTRTRFPGNSAGDNTKENTP